MSLACPAALCMKREGESEEEYRGRVAKARPEINKRLLVLIHALTQVGPALGSGLPCTLCVVGRVFFQ